MGIWLPLALADVTALLFKLVAMWAKNGDKLNIPKRSETLASWFLPFTSSSVKALEEEAERQAKAEKVKTLQAQLAALQDKYGPPTPSGVRGEAPSVPPAPSSLDNQTALDQTPQDPKPDGQTAFGLPDPTRPQSTLPDPKRPYPTPINPTRP